jgi:hypothetical protein
MARLRKGRSSYVTAAIIGIMVVLGTIIIANLDLLFRTEPRPIEPPARHTEVKPEEGEGLEPPRKPETVLEGAKREAEKLTAEWLEAMKTGNVDTLLRLSRPPFFIGNDRMISESDVSIRYLAMLERKVDRERPGEHQMIAVTIGESKDMGYTDEARESMLKRMGLNEDDIAVILKVVTETGEGEGKVFYFMRVEERVEMAGFRD